MFKKMVVSMGKVEDNYLILVKNIEKFNKKIRLVVEPENVAVVMKDNVCHEVFDFGEYKPFTKFDKNSHLEIIFVSKKLSRYFNFETRNTSFKDKNGKIYNLFFEGNYAFSIRNERKFLGTINYDNIKTKADFSNFVNERVCSLILQSGLNYVSNNKLSLNDFEKHKKEISAYVLECLDKYFDDTYGVEARKINIDIKIQSEVSFAG